MLNIVYVNCEGAHIETEWTSVRSFVLEMESDSIDIPMLDDQISTIDCNEYEELKEKNYEDFYTVGSLLETAKELLAKEGPRVDWIIGICSSESNGVRLYRFFGNQEEVKKKLLSFVDEDRKRDFENWDYGSEDMDDISDKSGNGTEFYAYGCYHDYHIDYTAKEFYRLELVADEKKIINTAEELVEHIRYEYSKYDSELNSLYFDVEVCMKESEILEAYAEIQDEINGDSVIRMVNGEEVEFIPDGMYENIYSGNCKDFLESFNGKEEETGFYRFDGEEQLDFIW